MNSVTTCQRMKDTGVPFAGLVTGTTMVGGATETMTDGDSRMECSAGEWNHYGGWGYRDYDR
jgi:hypothetical protein